MKGSIQIKALCVDKDTYVPPFIGTTVNCELAPVLVDHKTGRMLVHAGDDRSSVNVKLAPLGGLTLFGNAIYAPGDVMGGKLFAEALIGKAATALLESVRVIDMDNQGAEFDLIFLSGEPATSTLTDNAAPTWSDLDKTKMVGFVHIATTDYIAAGSGVVVAQKIFPLPIRSTEADGSVYVVIICRGTPTYTNNPLANVIIDLFVKRS